MLRMVVAGLGALLISALSMVSSAAAEGERAGAFDYYVLSLSWQPTWCALTGDAREAPECHARHDHGWLLHGLWPQNHRGWPSFCPSSQRPPSRAMTRDMSDIMGSAGLAWHQWKKHGTCAGVTAQAYFALSRRAYAQVTRPAVFRKLKDPVRVPAEVIETAFLRDNPDLSADMVTVKCKQNRINEVRICLSRDLDPVPCGRDVIRDCTAEDALFDPIR